MLWGILIARALRPVIMFLKNEQAWRSKWLERAGMAKFTEHDLNQKLCIA